MENVTLDRAVEVVRALRPEEQRRLIDLLETELRPSPLEMPAQERAFLEHLLAKGIIAHIPARYQVGYVDDYERHPPITVQGEPVSETVIRERR